MSRSTCRKQVRIDSIGDPKKNTHSEHDSEENIRSGKIRTKTEDDKQNLE